MKYTGFFDLIYASSSAEEQNRTLSNFLVPYEPVRKRARKDIPRQRISIQHLIRKSDGALINVCAKTFSSITTIGKYISD